MPNSFDPDLRKFISRHQYHSAALQMVHSFFCFINLHKIDFTLKVRIDKEIRKLGLELNLNLTTSDIL